MTALPDSSLRWRSRLAAVRQGGVLLLVAGIFAVAAALLTHPQWKDAPCEGDIALAEALQRQPPPLWIDASPAASFAAWHAPGALPLAPDRWAAQLPAVLQRWEPGQTAVVYCNSRACQASHDVAKRLDEFKLGPIYVLKGGAGAWQRK